MLRRIVADTNILVSAVGWRGPPAEIVSAAAEGRVVLVTSAPLLAEFFRVLQRPKFARVIPDPAGALLAVSRMAQIVETSERLSVINDEADNRVLEAAIAGDVDAIVSGDHHLLDLGSYADIPILTAAAAVRQLR